MAWVLPPPVIDAGKRQTLRYDDGTEWTGRDGCSGTFTPGAQRLREYIRQHFGIASIGGYSCRANTASPDLTSIHGVGRALDIMVSARTQKQLGDTIANWLVANAQDLGIQLVIWDHVIWNPTRGGEKWRPYTGPNPHTDHIHTELNLQGAAQQTPFYSTGILRAPVLIGAEGTPGAAPDTLSDAAKIGLVVLGGGTAALLLAKYLRG